MGFYKKVNKFGRLIWVAELEQCSDDVAVEISDTEYLSLTDTTLFDDLEISAE